MFKQINKTRIDVKSESGIFYVFPQWEVIDPEKQAISEQRQTVSLWSHYVGRIALLPAGKPYLMGLVFTHKNGDFGSVSVKEWGCAAPRRSRKWSVTCRIGSVSHFGAVGR